MKIAFTTSGNDLTAPLDSRFGRAPKFLVYNMEKKDFIIMDNTQNLNAPQGAGIQSAKNVIEAGVEVVVTGHTGPKAFTVLRQAKVRIFLCSNKTVQEALEDYQNGNLKEIDNADVDGHW